MKKKIKFNKRFVYNKINFNNIMKYIIRKMKKINIALNV